MPCCAAYNCAIKDSKQFREQGITFHRFPLKNQDLLKKWLQNIRRDNFTPSPRAVLCSAHFEEDCFYRFGEKKTLQPLAVPTKFTFPKHLQKEIKSQRKAPKTRTSSDVTLELDANQFPPSKVDPGEDHNYCVLESPRKLKRKLADAIEKVEYVQKKLKLSQQKVSRKEEQIMTMQQITMALKDKDLLSEKCAETLEKYSGLPKLILERMSKGTHAGEYSDEIRAFAMTLKFYSSKAYNFVRQTPLKPESFKTDLKTHLFRKHLLG